MRSWTPTTAPERRCSGRKPSTRWPRPTRPTVTTRTSREGATDVLILRDPRESAQKCSLTPLRGLPRIRFVNYHRERRLAAGRRILLHPAGELLGPDDRGPGVLVIDCSWRRVDALLATVDGELVHRRLPPVRTAYPRQSRVFQDPASGLASVEALFAALHLLGDSRPELLAGYHWRDEFLRLNPALQPAAAD